LPIRNGGQSILYIGENNMPRKTDAQIVMEYINKLNTKNEQPKKDTRKKPAKKQQENPYQELLDDKIYGILGG
jgi:hypothetical protein